MWERWVTWAIVNLRVAVQSFTSWKGASKPLYTLHKDDKRLRAPFISPSEYNCGPVSITYHNPHSQPWFQPSSIRSSLTSLDPRRDSWAPRLAGGGRVEDQGCAFREEEM